MSSTRLPFAMDIEHRTKGDGFFKGVRALPEFLLEVTVATGAVILFDFQSKLSTARFGMLGDRAMFESARTDGHYLIFSKEGHVPVRVSAVEFVDLVLNRRGG